MSTIIVKEIKLISTFLQIITNNAESSKLGITTSCLLAMTVSLQVRLFLDSVRKTWRTQHRPNSIESSTASEGHNATEGPNANEGPALVGLHVRRTDYRTFRVSNLLVFTEFNTLL